MDKKLQSLIPTLHQEFVLVVFLIIPYTLFQFDFSKKDLLILSTALMILMVVWLGKVFFQEKVSRQYKGFVVLVTGISLFVVGLYSSLVYYFSIATIYLDSLTPFIYLFFPIWIMLEGALLLFLLGFDSSTKTIGLENKIIVTKPTLGDFTMTALATAALVILGDWVLGLPWFINICVVFTVNLIIINQFSEK